MICPVVIAGGSGSRLWPLSRDLMPKQFLNFIGEFTLIQDTVNRLANIHSVPPLVICNEAHRFIAAEQLRQLGKLSNNIILEPVGRNTAPAIALAALTCLKKGNDPILLVLPADHLITDTDAFEIAVSKAKELAMAGDLVTFGILPTRPETGFGYIRSGDPIGDAYRIKNFVEKPDQDRAIQYLESGDYYWNSGMFMFKASTFLSELKLFRPDIFNFCELSISDVNLDLDFIRINEEAFIQCPDDSVDYAVMENTSRGVVVPLDAGWSDVGSWSALWDISGKDLNGNACKGDVITIDTTDSYIFSESALVATVGIKDIIVVQTKDSVLVAAKDKVQDIKQIVRELKHSARTEHITHREVYRPWGKYDSIDNGSRYQVKRITVKPGEKLSIQMHHHRAEHWIIVSGTAKVTVDSVDRLLTESESIYIPLGSIHALENPGKIPLELIEVQTGSYLGEDDIVRFSDRYGRI